MSATIGTKLFTLLQGKLIGTDEFGNRYFEARRAMQGDHKKRWVMYHGVVEASKVPAHWHGWLHYTLDAPVPESQRRYSWLKPHLPNLTGTIHRYLPQAMVTGKRAATTADYQPWQPK